MTRSHRNGLLGGLLFAAVCSACASIMGVEEPTLVDATVALPQDDAGPLGSDAAIECVGGCACKADDDCKADPYRKCVSGRCAECTTEPDSCSFARYCLPPALPNGLNACALGCKTDAECQSVSPATPFCITSRHQCAACRTEADCPNGNQKCSPSGTCADKCAGDGGTCPVAGQTCCDSLCVDTQTDLFNCKGCGIACGGADTLCCAGECKDPLTSADACGTCAMSCKSASSSAPLCVASACLPATCADVLATNPLAASGPYNVDPDGAGGAQPFPVLCDMTTDGGGWTLVGRETSGTTQQFHFLNADTHNPTSISTGSSGLLGKRFVGKYTQVWIAWSTASYIRFTKPGNFDLFANTVDTNVTLSNVTTSSTALAGWIAQDGGAKLCLATRNPTPQPGDSSWAIKPRNDNNTDCGCNSMSWVGRGAFYGGAVNGQQTSCGGYGGGWAGVRDTGEQKGGVVPTYETRIWIR